MLLTIVRCRACCKWVARFVVLCVAVGPAWWADVADSPSSNMCPPISHALIRHLFAGALSGCADNAQIMTIHRRQRAN